MYIWDYTTRFSHYPAPHPNWRVLQPNVQAMVKNNVRGIFEQACGASRGGVDFNELRLYLISKLLWDPYCDIETHKKEFMEYYYGAASVSGDALRLWRVEKNRLSVRWIRLKRASMLRGEYDPEKINAFFSDWRAFNLSRIDEWCDLETTHRAFLDGIWRGVEYFDHWTGEEPEIF